MKKLTELEIKQLKQNNNFVENVEYYMSELNKLNFFNFPYCISENETIYDDIVEVWSQEMIGNIIYDAQLIIHKDDWTDEDWEKALFEFDYANDVRLDFPEFRLW